MNSAPLRQAGRAALLALLCLACGPRRPHILLVTLDTTRADHLGCYGHRAAQTPVLDSLASAGSRFVEAFTPVPLTLPAHASMMTGLFPWEHGVRDNGLYRLDDASPVLAELLSKRGYWCAAVVGAYPLAAQYGLARGFAVYDDALRSASTPFDYPERPAFEVTTRALEILAARPEGSPVFLWVHYFDPHAPYANPRGSMTGYDVEIARVDGELGRLLRGLPAGAWAVVAVGDHGEGLGEHGEETHGDFLYRATLRVPLILRGSRWGQGVTRRDPASVVDVFSTILAAARVPIPANSGRDLSRIPATRPLAAETAHPLVRYGWPPLRSVEHGGWKLIQGERMELFHVASDPQERDDKSRVHPDTVAALLPLLPPLVEPGGTVPLGLHDREALTALGYFPEPGRAITPRDQLLRMLESGNELVQQKRWEAAREIFAAVIARDPGNLWARMGVGTCLASQGDLAAADSAFRSVLSAHPAYLPALQNLAMVRLMLGDDEEAERLHHAVLEIMPSDATSLEALAVCLRRQGKHAESLAAYRRLAAARPFDARVLRDMGSLLAYELSDRAEATALWKQALQLDPHLPQRREMEREMQRWSGQAAP